MASENPASRAVMGSSPLLWALIARTPISLARSNQAFSRSIVRSVSYLLRSNLADLRRASSSAARLVGARLLAASPLLRGAGGGANRSPLPNAGRLGLAAVEAFALDSGRDAGDAADLSPDVRRAFASTS